MSLEKHPLEGRVRVAGTLHFDMPDGSVQNVPFVSIDPAEKEKQEPQKPCQP
jgi:hypothetical protein